MNHGEAVITGASSGIGLAVARRLLGEGWSVCGLSRRSVPLQHDRLCHVAVDFGRLETLPSVLEPLARQLQPRALVLCAGAGRFGSLEEFSYEQIRQSLELNLISHVYVLRAFLPAMKRVGAGDVVLIGSESALVGGARGAVYCAAKFGLRGLSQALREECARAGVRITIINPGMVRSSFFDPLSFEPGPAPENAIAPEEVARAVDMVLKAPAGTVFDEVNLSPLKKVVAFKKTPQRQ